MTDQGTLDQEYIQNTAEEIAELTLRGSDAPRGDWKDAGYASAEAAAEVLIGSMEAGPIKDLAIQLVADRIR